jgi:selenide, water dikinase
MMNTDQPKLRDLVLVGGGHTHALIAKMLAMNPIPGLRVTLVSEVSHAPYSGMLPGLIAGEFSYDEAHIDLRKLCGYAGIEFIHSRVTNVDVEAKIVSLAGRPSLEFDIVSINIGITPIEEEIEGSEHTYPVKPVPQFLKAWEDISKAFLDQPGQTVSLVGGGAGAVELALSVRAKLGASARIRIVQRSSEVLPTHAEKAQKYLLQELKAHRIEVLTGRAVVRCTEQSVVLEDGSELPSDHTLLLTSAKPAGWLRETGLKLAEGGFIEVLPTLQSPTHDFAFACGDVATCPKYPRPKSGVFAVRQAKPLLANLRRYIRGQTLKEFRPQEKFLSLIGNAHGKAVASRGEFAMNSWLMLKLKHYIDFKFMRKFSDLKERDDPRFPFLGRPFDKERQALESKAQKRCRGCAGKYPGDLLVCNLEEMGAVDDKGFEDSATIKLDEDRNLVQSVDTLVEFLGDPYTFGKVAFQHAANDILAMGTKPHSLLVSAGIPFGSDRVIERSLTQVMAGVREAAAELQAEIIGGHTYFAAELSLTLCLNGFLEKGHHSVEKATPREGDVLVLTKALGSGTLFAAHMRAKAKGRWLDAAIESMRQSHRSASETFRECQVSALTDVSGFGLLGHLAEMFQRTDLLPHFDTKLPVLEGAQEVLSDGVQSSLHDSNRRYAGKLLKNRDLLQYEIALTPETSGPMLASVPAHHAGKCLELLHRAGYTRATRIGVATRP